MAEKSAQNIISGIEKSKEIPFEKVLYGIGIKHVGETVAKKLVKNFATIDELKEATVEELCQVEDIGAKIAVSIVEFFKNSENILMIERLKSYGVQLEKGKVQMKFYRIFWKEKRSFSQESYHYSQENQQKKWWKNTGEKIFLQCLKTLISLWLVRRQEAN